MKTPRFAATRRLTLPVVFAAALLALSIGIAACGSSGGDGEESKSYRIVQIPTSLSDFTHTVNLGAKEEAKRLGAEVELQIPATFDVNAQTATINAVIASRPDAILLEPVDGEGMVPAVARAQQAGIVVVTYDSNVADEGLPDAYVAVDYVNFGKEIAATLDELVGGKGELMHLAGIPGLPVSEHIKEGYLDYMSEHPGLQSLPIQYTQFETPKASSITEATITANPDLAGAFVGTLTELTGALSAINRAGVADQQVKTISWDGTPEAIELLKKGELDRVISAPARTYGVEAVKAAVAVLKGEEPPAQDLKQLQPCIISAETIGAAESQPCEFEQARNAAF